MTTKGLTPPSRPLYMSSLWRCKCEIQAFLSLDAVELLKTKELHEAVGAPIYCPEPQIRVSAAQCQHGLIWPAQYNLVTSLLPTAGAQLTNSTALGVKGLRQVPTQWEEIFEGKEQMRRVTGKENGPQDDRDILENSRSPKAQ